VLCPNTHSSLDSTHFSAFHLWSGSHEALPSSFFSLLCSGFSLLVHYLVGMGLFFPRWCHLDFQWSWTSTGQLWWVLVKKRAWSGSRWCECENEVRYELLALLALTFCFILFVPSESLTLALHLFSSLAFHLSQAQASFCDSVTVFVVAIHFVCIDSSISCYMQDKLLFFSFHVPWWCSVCPQILSMTQMKWIEMVSAIWTNNGSANVMGTDCCLPMFSSSRCRESEGESC
jgi:hypothetical protein